MTPAACPLDPQPQASSPWRPSRPTTWSIQRAYADSAGDRRSARSRAVIIDPTAARILREHAVRLFQWTQYMDDLSGHEGNWAADRAPGDTVSALVKLAGRSLLPMMAACFTAMLVPNLIGAAPIYDSLRERTLRLQQTTIRPADARAENTR